MDTYVRMYISNNVTDNSIAFKSILTMVYAIRVPIDIKEINTSIEVTNDSNAVSAPKMIVALAGVSVNGETCASSLNKRPVSKAKMVK